MNLTLSLSPELVLRAEYAADLMTPNPVSVRADATVREAIALLVDNAYSAAPVIDHAGRAVGVVSRSDILAHERERVEHAAPVPEYYRESDLTTDAGEFLPGGFQVEQVQRTRVEEIMTPAVFAVRPDTPVATVVNDLLALKVHRLFVVDRDGVLVGVISTLDVLRHLQP
jgi:CBS domain-containing protein